MSIGAINIKRNNYNETPKEYRIYTPLDISYFLYEFILGYSYNAILDLCCGDGSLSIPFRQTAKKIIGIDKENTEYDCGDFIKCDFIKDKSYDQFLIDNKIDLVLCNPPWNHCEGRKLYPYEFLKRLWNVFGSDIPFVLFTPMGLRLNRRYGAKRGKELKKMFSKGLQLSCNISMPIDAFCPGNKEKGQQWEILIFNLMGVQPSYWYTDEDRVLYSKIAQEMDEEEWFHRNKATPNFGDLGSNTAKTIEHCGRKIMQDSFL